MLLVGWVTLTHSSGMGAGLEEVALDDGLGEALAAGVAKKALSVAVAGVDEVLFAGVVDGLAVELELGLAELGAAELGFAEAGAFAELEPAGGWVGALDWAGLLAWEAGVVGVWVGVPGDDVAAATCTQFLLVAGLAARASGAA